MPQTPHIEKHFTASKTVRDIVIGMSDGLFVQIAEGGGTDRGRWGDSNHSSHGLQIRGCETVFVWIA